MIDNLHDPPLLPADVSWKRPLHEAWTLDRLEEEYIRTVLRQTGGNRRLAARILGIDRRTLDRRMARRWKTSPS